jgi:hypothetical protein
VLLVYCLGLSQPSHQQLPVVLQAAVVARSVLTVTEGWESLLVVKFTVKISVLGTKMVWHQWHSR